jgi:hypothetical protein
MLYTNIFYHETLKRKMFDFKIRDDWHYIGPVLKVWIFKTNFIQIPSVNLKLKLTDEEFLTN